MMMLSSLKIHWLPLGIIIIMHEYILVMNIIYKLTSFK